MGARVSAKGVTKYGFGRTDPTLVTAQEKEAAAVKNAGNGMPAPPPPRDYPSQGATAGRKAKGATRTKGGAI